MVLVGIIKQKTNSAKGANFTSKACWNDKKKRKKASLRRRSDKTKKEKQ
jgi:hypothetical protein